jgi:predicted RNase H-like HicB family nuclease
MADKVAISLKLMCHVREDKDIWVAGCPSLSVFSQGSSKDDAMRCLKEALELWIESCIERDTLDGALRDCGFRIARWDEPVPNDVEKISVQREADDVLGEPFPLDITIPAYQASVIMSANRPDAR